MAVAPADFTHLHVHSEFSLLDGLGRITELVDEAKVQGFDSLALTDHGALYGAVAFYQACKTAGIKPIIGVETYVARRSMSDREGKADSQPYHLILLAKDWTGYQNLCRIVTDAHLDGYYYKPRIDREYLAQHAEGLVGLSACLNGEVARAIETGDMDNARRIAGSYRDILGDGNFFFELQDHGLPEQRKLNEHLLRLGPEMGIPLVATNDLHYVRKAQSDAHDVLLCVGTASNLDTPGRMRFESADFYLKSAADMAKLFAHVPEAISNTRRIAEMVDLELPFGQLRLPDFPVPQGYTVESWLRAECERGLRNRYGDVTTELQQRLDYELDVIIRMGYAGYFLIVADFVRFARDNRIATTCRGSAPGSIVTYTLGITPVDPILYQLPFERFLNPDRVTMPDIDVDFEDARRDEVIRYVTQKYGTDHVAQIITFGTMLARAAIRDVGRVLGFSYGEVDRIAKAIPNQLGIKLEEALAMTPALREMRDADINVKRLLDLAATARGCGAQRVHARSRGGHQPRAADGADAPPARDELGRADDPVRDARRRGARPAQVRLPGPLQPDHPSPGGRPHQAGAEESRSTSTSSRSKTPRRSSCWRRARRPASSSLSRRACAATCGSCARPPSWTWPRWWRCSGRDPMDNIPAYIRRKHGQEQVTYLHPLLEPYLKKTYGIFVYQEDIMSAAIALGGFTGPEADTLGYAIRKKKSSVLRAQKDKFVQQAAERGVPPHIIDAVFKAFEPFERYGFNKAHATCYGLIAYQTAYLKANYTVEYMTSVLTAMRDSTDKVAAAIAECRRLGIEVLPPDVHRSGLDFTVESDAIRFGLLAIKNVGHGAIESIVAARTEGGAFKSLADFCNRIDLRLVNRRVLESLIRVGGAERTRPSGSAPDGPRRRAVGRPGRSARPAHRPGLAVRLRQRLGPAGASAARWNYRGRAARASALGEGAARPVPVRSPAGRARRHDRRLRQRLQRRDGRGARSAARRDRRRGHRRPARHHQGTRDDGRGHAGGPPGHDRGDRVPQGLRADRTDMGRGRHPAGGGPCRSQGRGDRSPRRFRLDVGAGDAARAAGIRARGCSRRSRPAVRLTPRTRTGASNGNGFANGHSATGGSAPQAAEPSYAATAGPSSAVVPVAVGPGPSEPRLIRTVPRVSPLRGGQVDGIVDVYLGGAPVRSLAALVAPGDTEEPALPEEAVRELIVRERAPTVPLQAGAGQSLHIRLMSGAQDELLQAMRSLRNVFHEHPGETPVVLHVPVAAGRSQRMELRLRVAYDAELVALIARLVGPRMVDLSLAE